MVSNVGQNQIPLILLENAFLFCLPALAFMYPMHQWYSLFVSLFISSAEEVMCQPAFVCEANNSNCYEQILMKCPEKVDNGKEILIMFVCMSGF